MTLKVLLIDDKADEFRHSIEKSLQSIEVDFRLALCRDNHEAQVKEALEKGCDMIILDWLFPEGPEGKETLELIRKWGFEGPVILHSERFSNYGEYVGKKMADAYVYRGLGDSCLTDALRRSIETIRNRNSSGIRLGQSFDLTWYQDMSAINRHAYHPRATETLPPAQKESSRAFVSLLTTEWDEDSGTATNRAMGQVIQDIERVADKDISVLIQGPSGTGKELVAKLLHYHHKDPSDTEKRDLYVARNCGAFPENLLNIELFGSLPGAFTGAISRAGIFEQVTEYDKSHQPIRGGTIFLDEIALMKKLTQEHLLRVLEDGYVLRMNSDLSKAYPPDKKIPCGSGEMVERWYFGKIPVQFRIVSATNQDLKQMVDDDDFRLDLYRRIYRWKIDLPCLINRSIHDFNLLFQYFLKRFSEKYNRPVILENDGSTLSGKTRGMIVSLFTNSTWDGNVRDLEGVAQVVVVNKKDHEKHLCLEDIPEFRSNEIFNG